MQVPSCCPRLKGCPLAGVGTLLSLGAAGGQQAGEGPEWFFRLEKPILYFHGLLHECIVLGFYEQSQHGKGFFDSLQSLMLQGWILGYRNKTATFHCLQLWAPISIAALVDNDCVCMSSSALFNTPLFVLCSSCRMFWASQSAPDAIVIGQNGDTWKRKKSINLILKRVLFSWVNCLWRQQVTTHVGGPASCLAMSLWRDVSSQTDHPPSPVPSSSPQLLQKVSK